MLICRAEDGLVFEIQETASDIEKSGNLNLFLQNVTGVPAEVILAYLSDGHVLRDDNIRERITSTDQSIFVYNKSYIHAEPNLVLEELRVAPPEFDPPADVSPAQIASEIFNWMNAVVISIRTQMDALHIASRGLDLNVLSLSDVYDTFSESAKANLKKQELLLRGIDVDLGVISKVKVHSDFLTPAVRKGIESGDRPRTLGDYVSHAKMKQVAENCATLHSVLQSRFEEAEKMFQMVATGAEGVRKAIASLQCLEQAEAVISDAKAAVDTLHSAESPDEDLHVANETLAQCVYAVCDVKNSTTEQCLICLRDISVLNTDLTQLPAVLSSLQMEFRAKNSFAHIQRLHNMLYAYGATLIEVVRRKEFAAFFSARTGTIAEILAKLSVGEKKRRQIYRGDIQGLMPFEIRGLDDKIPSAEVNALNITESQFTIARQDVENFLSEVNRIENSIQSLKDSGERGLHPLQETKDMWTQLIERMDNLESNFDRVTERTLLSSSRIIRRSAILDHPAHREALEKLQKLQLDRSEVEAQYDDHRHAYEAEIDRLRSQLEDLTDGASHEQTKAEHLEQETAALRMEVVNERDAHANALREQERLHAEVALLRQQLDESRLETRSKAKEVDQLRAELTQVATDYQEVKNLEEQHALRVEALLKDQQETLQNLEEARSRGENLESQIQTALTEGGEARRELQDVRTEKDRLLRMQASEHDRRLRDQIAEADGDRAVLEKQFFQLKSEVETMRVNLETTHADLSGVREELQRTSHELSEAVRSEQALKNEMVAMRVSQSDIETRYEHSQRLVAEIMQVAISLRQFLVRAMVSAQSASSYPKTQPLSESVFSTGARPPLSPGLPVEEAPSIDPTDPEMALEVLREFDFDICAEALAKPVTVLKKWQRQCKEYRERAKGRITFRNFAKGDLALFLPIKNSQQKPWAAFNVAFPHYFLQPTGNIAEQLKTREWIVARIVSITERIASHQDPDSNPYGLSDGIKFYMCQVEDWTQPSAKRTNSTPSRNVSGETAVTVITSNAKAGPVNMTNQAITVESPTPTEFKPVDTALPPPPLSDPEDGVLEPSPSSHLFPTRTRLQQSPSRAGPSSLSKLLAQAPPPDRRNSSESPPGPLIPSPPPTAKPRTPPNRPEIVTATPPGAGAIPIIPSPRKQSPRERAFSNSVASSISPRAPRSRASSSSTHAGRKFPVTAPSPLSASPKAVATTALTRTTSTGQAQKRLSSTALRTSEVLQATVVESPSPPPGDRTPGSGDRAPSPADSAGEGMMATLSQVRKRVTSDVGRSVGNAATLGGFATFGFALGRKLQSTRKPNDEASTSTSDVTVEAGPSRSETAQPQASDLRGSVSQNSTSRRGATELLKNFTSSRPSI